MKHTVFKCQNKNTGSGSSSSVNMQLYMDLCVYMKISILKQKYSIHI
jgi:hypothetical protein